MDLVFRETCEDVQLSTCEHGARFPDPCNCRTYYECGTSSMNFRTCPIDQQYDTDRKSCVDAADVTSCDIFNRCNVTEERMSFLSLLCDSGTAAPPDGKSDLDTTNLGLFVGIAVGYVVVAVLLVVVVIIYRRGQRTLVTMARSALYKSRTTDVHTNQAAVDGIPFARSTSLVGTKLMRSTSKPCCSCEAARVEGDNSPSIDKKPSNGSCCPCDPPRQPENTTTAQGESGTSPDTDCTDCLRLSISSQQFDSEPKDGDGKVNYGYVAIEDNNLYPDLTIKTHF